MSGPEDDASSGPGEAEGQSAGLETKSELSPRPGPALTMHRVVATVTQQRDRLAPCFRAAVTRGDVERGRDYRLDLTWRITPDGRVVAAEVTAPAELARGSLANCLSLAMGRWRFPRSPRGAVIRGYPFGPVSIR